MPPEQATLPSDNAPPPRRHPPDHPRPTNPFIEFAAEEVEQSIPARFERQVDRYPDRRAIKVGPHQLTYAELNRAANRVARAILARTGHEQEPVALLLEHGASLIAAILGALKAGKIYLPLDPSYPRARSAYMLEDAGATLVVTSGRHLALAGGLNEAARPPLNIDEVESTTPEVNLDLPVPPDALAYILYTSGSTGRPKGVVQNHRNVLWDIREYTNTLHICPDDRMTLLYSCSVNGAVRGIFGALLNGAALYPLDIKEQGLNGLADLLSREEITFFHSVPTVFRHFVATLTGTERFPKLRLVRFGGERVLARDVEAYRKHFPDNCLLYTGMGATETGHVRHYFLDRRTPVTGSVVPTGYAVEGKEVLLLDDTGREAAAGHPGEIAVRSRYLALGYWRKPDATRAAFLSDPAGGSQRIFRTGDIGRMHPDGCLEHLGRKDFQVKVRGYRIEIAEIETALLGLAGVRDAVVVARDEGPGEQQLVAYVVPEPSQAPVVGELRRLLKDEVPEHMVPSAFVLLEALPLTPNGKVDRLALPPPVRTRPGSDRAVAAPRTPVEEVLAGIWADALGLQRVSVDDNFFELGGHSLLATRVLARLRDTLQVDLPLRAFFDRPTLAGLAEVIRSEGPVGDRSAPPILPASRDAELPLSFTQERLWFLHQLDPASQAYHVPATLRFRGPFDLRALQDSLTEMVRRHEAFRTTFPTSQGRPSQRIHQPYLVHLPVVSLEAVPEREREAELRRVIAEQIRQPFDITRLPLVRWTVMRLGAEDHVLLRVEHHLLGDGWSFHLFLGELLALYRAFSAGEPSPLAEPPMQIADFACWQRQWMQGPVAEAQLAYWKTRLAQSPPVLELPSDRPRPAVQTFTGASSRVDLSPPLRAALRRVSRQEGTTLFMTMLAAFLTLLQRYTGQSDVSVGSVVANRRWRETEGMIGPALNTMILRADLSADPTFQELLRRVRDVTLEAYAHQDVPFDKVVEALQPERSSNYTPLTRVMFNFHDARLPSLELGETSLELTELIDNHSAKFDLNLIVLPLSEQCVGSAPRAGDDRLTVNWEFNTDLFDAATIGRMAEHYQELLEGIATDPGRRVSALPLLTEAERGRLLVEWNATARAYPRDACVHQVFEAQAAETPGAVAVVYRDERLTYRELDRRANRLAHHLQESGVGPEVRVAVALERSVDLVVTLLAVLKAGGAYVPLDPSYPEERLAFMVADARVSVLVTTKRLGRRLSGHGVRLVRLDTDGPRIAAASPECVASGAGAESLAYVSYTSGSTGSPKGVAVPHRAVVRLVRGTSYVRLAPDEVLLQLAPVSFDASTFEIWGALLSGARLAVAPAHTLSLAELGRTLREHQVTTLWLTAGLFRRMVDEQLEDLRGVRQLLAGGDVLSVPHVRRVLGELPACRLVNGYGPTEATTFSCCYPAPRPLPGSCDSLPIGGPIANTRVYVLDRYLSPVPTGVPGELYIGGDGLARGYLGRPALTAERFVPDPFGAEPGSRLYRTGDRVRWLPEGVLEFLGRLDQQVKVRGYRVEPAEVEAALAEHSAVREAAVVARADPAGEKHLVAYVVPREERNEGAPPAAELRRFLEGRLPGYMVPSAFVVVGALPLTASGKLDRAVLPTLAPSAGTGLEREAAFVAPRTTAETVLAAIWAEVLGVSRVGVHDNFFALGGHSLLATQVVSRIRSEFALDMPLRLLFERPTVSGLAGAVEQARDGGGIEAEPLVPGSRDAAGE
jgi:amino acid adenylation domain-containing protein